MSKFETTEEQRQPWEERLEDFQASGQSATEWCKEHGVPVHQLRYRLRKHTVKRSRDAALGTQRWASIDPGNSSNYTGICLRYGSLTLELQRGFDPQVLSDVLRSLMQEC